jgi:hypothetical protein
MNETERLLLAALQELDQVVKTIANTQPKPDLLGHFRRIESLAAKAGKEIDPQLAHYIQRGSYQKALAWFTDHETRP